MVNMNMSQNTLYNIWGILLLFMALLFNSLFLAICAIIGIILTNITHVINYSKLKKIEITRIDQLNSFINELQKTCQTKRVELDSIPEEQLVNNENFNICMKIAAILSTINTARASFDAFSSLVESSNYNIDTFLNNFNIIWEEKDGKKVPKILF